MNPSLVLIAIVGCFIWLFLYRFRDNLLRAYGVFFLILIIYATNKAYYGISPEMSESTFSPLSLVRWGALIFFAWYSWRVRFPANYRTDVVLSVIVFLLLSDMLLSSFVCGKF